MDLSRLTDGELARLLGGDRASDAFTVLYERYVRPIHDFVARTVRDLAAAEDLTQRAFIQAWEQRGSLRDPDAVKPWLYRVASNLALNHVTRTRAAVDIDDVAAVVEAPGADPESAALTAEAARLVWDAAASLEPRQRTVLELAVRRELTSPEIAAVLEVAPAQASLLVHRAKEALGNAVRYLLVARRRTHCPRLAQMVPAGILQLSAEQRASVDRHMRRCDSCQGMANLLTRPESLLGALILVPLPRSLERPPHLALTGARLAGAGATAGAVVPISGASTGPAAPAGLAATPVAARDDRRRRRRAAFLLLAVLLLGAVGGGLVLLRAFTGSSSPVSSGAGVPAATPAVTAAAVATDTPTALPSGTAAPAATVRATPAAIAVPAATATPKPTPRPTPTATPGPGFTVASISLCFDDATGTGCQAAPTTQTCVANTTGPAPTWQCAYEITFHLTPGKGGTIAWSLAGMLGTGCSTALTPLAPAHGTTSVPTPAPSQLTVTESLSLGTSNPRSWTATKYPRSSATLTAAKVSSKPAYFYGTSCG